MTEPLEKTEKAFDELRAEFERRKASIGELEITKQVLLRDADNLLKRMAVMKFTPDEEIKFANKGGAEKLWSAQPKETVEFEKEQETNEEWLRQASTEELAEWIKAVIENCRDCGRSKKMFMEDCPFGKYCAYEVGDWLKEKHDA